MTEKFRVIEGGKAQDGKTLPRVHEKIKHAIMPFAHFDDMATEVVDISYYRDFSNDELAYEAESLAGKLQDPGGELSDLLSRAIALEACISLRIGS